MLVFAAVGICKLFTLPDVITNLFIDYDIIDKI